MLRLCATVLTARGGWQRFGPVASGAQRADPLAPRPPPVRAAILGLQLLRDDVAIIAGDDRTDDVRAAEGQVSTVWHGRGAQN